MSSKEQLYHQADVIAVPAIILSGILLCIMGNMADLNQISMGDPIASTSASLTWFIFGLGALWILISVAINRNMKAMVTRGLDGILKSFIAKAMLFAVLIVALLVSSLLVIGFLVLAGYLFVTSVRALMTGTSTFSQNVLLNN